MRVGTGWACRSAASGVWPAVLASSARIAALTIPSAAARRRRCGEGAAGLRPGTRRRLLAIVAAVVTGFVLVGLPALPASAAGSARTVRVSVSSSGAQGNDISAGDPAVSADGRYVAFGSTASNLVPGDT